jgi:endonuclease G
VPELAPTIEDPACFAGCPEILREKNRNTVLRREGFVLSNNPETKFADWAAYRITASTIAKSRRGKWLPDPELPSAETLEAEDFKGAHAALNTDRGHQVPLASFSGSRDWQALNYFSNLTPQRSDLNQRLWNHLEQAERELALDSGVEAVFVVTGPLFEREMPVLPEADEGHRVPSGYFKIIILVPGGVPSVAAFLVDQETPSRDSYCIHRATVREVEARAQMDFFRALPGEREGALEEQAGTLYEQLGCP